MFLLFFNVYIFKRVSCGINRARKCGWDATIIKYLKGESPNPTKQPHVYKHDVLDVIAFDPTF